MAHYVSLYYIRTFQWWLSLSVVTLGIRVTPSTRQSGDVRFNGRDTIVTMVVAVQEPRVVTHISMVKIVFTCTSSDMRSALHQIKVVTRVSMVNVHCREHFTIRTRVRTMLDRFYKAPPSSLMLMLQNMQIVSFDWLDLELENNW